MPNEFSNTTEPSGLLKNAYDEGNHDSAKDALKKRLARLREKAGLDQDVDAKVED